MGNDLPSSVNGEAFKKIMLDVETVKSYSTFVEANTKANEVFIELYLAHCDECPRRLTCYDAGPVMGCRIQQGFEMIHEAANNKYEKPY